MLALRFFVLLMGLALAPAAGAVAADHQDMPRGNASSSASEVDDLLERLRETQDETEASIIEGLVVAAWAHSPSPTASLLYDRAAEALNDEDIELSISLLDRVVELEPRFAQAWYQWATLHYLMDDYETAIAGLERALDLEPRHFGALAGLATIFEAYGNEGAALKALRRAYEINPHLENAQSWIRRLEHETLGRGI